tara:strand:+ start:1062 stop:1286 length:225 start_codon:yes stop_codon:yes gene_type:complete
MDRKYVILESSEVSSVDFSKVLEDSSNTLRYNNNNTKTFVKYTGDQPVFLNGKTELTYVEIIAELARSEWQLAE